MPVRKRKQKGLRVSNFAFSLAIFKRHHGSEGVKQTWWGFFLPQKSGLFSLGFDFVVVVLALKWAMCASLEKQLIKQYIICFLFRIL